MLLMVPVVGNFYAVFADSPQGYYIVQCTRVSKDKFSANYLAATSREDPLNAFFKITSEKDNFYYRTIADEVVSVIAVGEGNSNCICVSKIELNDIISTIAELDDQMIFCQVFVMINK